MKALSKIAHHLVELLPGQPIDPCGSWPVLLAAERSLHPLSVSKDTIRTQGNSMVTTQSVAVIRFKPG